MSLSTIKRTRRASQRTKRYVPIALLYHPTNESQVYHVLVDRLKILDHGDGEAWNPPIPALPERPYYSPATPKRGRDVAADAAFDGFGSRSSPSPSKRPKRK
jgi:hypothetical protein